MSWPENAMAFYLTGFLAGVDRGRELAEAEMARLWAPAFETVRRHAGGTSYAEHQERRRARQVEACEQQRRDAVPWPDEVAS